jgi:hypothetical protein
LGYIAEAHPGFNVSDPRATEVLAGRGISPIEEQEIREKGIERKEPPVTNILMYYWALFCSYILVLVYRLKHYSAADASEYFDSNYSKSLGSDLNAKWPVLVLYSEEDFIVPSTYVEQFWTKFAKKGNVTLKKFSGNYAHHMKIFVKHGDEYCAEISNFLKKINNK